MSCRSACSWPATSREPWLGATARSMSIAKDSSPSKETVPHDEDPVLASAILRGFRRRSGVALSGAARDPLVLVSDLARPAGGAPTREQAHRCAGGWYPDRASAAARARLRPRRDAHLDAVLLGGRQDGGGAQGREPRPQGGLRRRQGRRATGGESAPGASGGFRRSQGVRL